MTCALMGEEYIADEHDNNSLIGVLNCLSLNQSERLIGL